MKSNDGFYGYLAAHTGLILVIIGIAAWAAFEYFKV